ncbi:hypothetical protein V1289_008298 [Bradyrhizobium sp. AZCC 2289]
MIKPHQILMRFMGENFGLVAYFGEKGEIKLPWLGRGSDRLELFAQLSGKADIAEAFGSRTSRNPRLRGGRPVSQPPARASRMKSVT